MTARPWRAAALSTVVAGLAALYVAGALAHLERVNTIRKRTDQGAYLQYASKLVTSGYEHHGGRNRMPMYPLYLSLFYRSEMSEDEFFRAGKYASIWLSLATLAAVSAVLFRTLRPWSATALAAITAATVWVFRAAYVQAELLYYTLAFLAFVATWRVLERPSAPRAALAGGLFALAHLTKASSPPAVALAVLVLAGATLARVPAGSVHGRTRWRPAVAALVLALAYLAVLSPYLRNSERLYGRYFYNVNSTFYIWYDSWAEAKAGTRADGDRSGWPHTDPESTPSPRKYFREHTAPQMWDRLDNGMREQWRIVRRSHAWGKYVLGYGAVVALFGALHWRALRRELVSGGRAWPAAFAAGYFVLYLVLYAWYQPIADGPRFLLSLFLPTMWALFRFLDGCEARGLDVGIGRARLSPRWVHAAALLVLAVDVALFLPERLLRDYAGG